MVKRILTVAFLLVFLPACGLLGSDSEPANSEPAPLQEIEPADLAPAPGAGTPEPESPRQNEAAASPGLPPTYTPAPQDFLSGAPTSAAPGAGAGTGAFPVLTGNEKTHLVVKGDTLGAIAQFYGVSLDRLVNANRRQIKDIDLIYPGQVLIIPEP